VGSTLLTSPDGEIWTARPWLPPYFNDIAFGNGTFVAVGGRGWIVQSDVVQ